jgi:cardiolipin synthase (CMP-forming)
VPAKSGDSSRIVTIPNAISAVRLLFVPVFAILLARHDDAWAFVVLALSGASDWLDGVLARRLHQVSELGKVLDPAADRLFILVTLVALAWRDVVPWWLVVAIVLRDVLMGGLLFPLAHRGYGPLPVHFVGKAGTFALLYALPLLLLAQRPDAWGTAALVLGWAFAWWGIGLYWLAGALYATQARRLLGATGAA